MTVDEIIQALRSGHFDVLIGLVETSEVEAKGAPYHLSLGDPQKHELAKDVSALANADGGIILLGFRTERDSLNPLEQIKEYRPFDSAMVDAEQYRKVLEEWIYPPVHSVQVIHCPLPSNSAKCLVAIHVPPAATDDKPYIVTKSVPEDGLTRGTMIGYYERVQDRIPPTSPETIRTRLRDGMRFGEVSQRLDSLQSVITNLSSSPKLKPGGLTDTEVLNRISRAQKAIDRATAPTIAFAATPSNPVTFHRLFHSDSEVVRLIEHSPRLRDQGFDIHVDGRSEIINGELRRVSAPGSRIVEAWSDGLLLAVGQGDDDLLCWWSGRRKPGNGLPIRNFVLTEVTLNFLILAAEVYKYAQHTPDNLRILLSLNNMNVDGLSATLSPIPDMRERPTITERVAPSDAMSIWVNAPFKDIDLGSVAYELLGRFYTKFGFNYDEMPYVQKSKQGNRITPETLLGQYKIE